MSTALGRNPQQMGNRFAHRPELRDLGWVFYAQRNRIAARLRKAMQRIERARRMTKNQSAWFTDE